MTEPQSLDASASNSKATTVTGLAALTAGLAGIAASSCCVLPLVLATSGLGSIAAALVPTLAAWQGVILALAVALVGAAWFVYLRRNGRGLRNAALRRPVPRYLMGVTAVVLVALLWGPFIEYPLLARIR
jgi:mercuric ion transport protein